MIASRRRLEHDGGAITFSDATDDRPQHLPEDPRAPVVLPEGWQQIGPSAHAVNGGALIDERPVLDWADMQRAFAELKS